MAQTEEAKVSPISGPDLKCILSEIAIFGNYDQKLEECKLLAALGVNLLDDLD